MKKIPIIMDCDPGHDDAIALVVALVSDNIEVKGITVAAGNQTLKKTTSNTLKILTLLDKDIPVAVGRELPLFRDLISVPVAVHGDSGLDGPILPTPKFQPLEINSVEMMAKIIRESSEKITIVATGPLTNVALFLLVYPNLISKIEKISIMGGGIKETNWSPAAEFNILVDPEAAKIVFESGIPIVMSGLDVTHKALFLEDDIKTIKSLNTPVSSFVGDLLDFFYIFHKEQGFLGAPVHDLCAVAYLIDPTLFSGEEYFVMVETKGEFTQGATIADVNKVLHKPSNALVLLDVKREKIVELLISSIKKY